MRGLQHHRRSPTFAVAALVAAAAFSAGHGRCDDAAPLAAQPLLDRLGRAVQELAKKGRKAEVDEAISVLRDLRAPAKDVDAQRLAATKTLAKAKDAGLPLPEVGKTLTKLAADLAGGLGAQEGDARAALARQILRIDATVRDAHAALGDVEHAGRFVPAAVAPCLARRAEIQEAVRKAWRLEVTFETGASALPVIERLYGKKGVCLRHGNLAAHTVDFEPAQLERQMREVLRALALSRWLTTGALEIPKLENRLDLVFTSSKPTYLKALRDACDHGEITAAEAEAAKGWLGYAGKTHRLFDLPAESEIRVWGLLHSLGTHENYTTSGGGPQTALFAGHINWLYSNFLGSSMPDVAWVGSSSSGKGGGETRDTPAESEKRKEMVRLARAGLQGTRRFIDWLARRGEDPAWSRAMVPSLDKLGGVELLKTTVVVDWLQETGEFAKLYADTTGKPGAPATFDPLFPGGLAALEPRWREWLFADEPPAALVQRLTAQPETLTPGEAAATRRLDALRSAAMSPKPPSLGVDRDLSAGCLAHAAYLLKHPKQLAAWPDAHEEFPGEEGWTAAGARAGMQSVIYPGVSGADEAVDGWMATFYHRLPLLDPGLLRIGFALEKGVAVLDAGGLVGPPEFNYEVHWPATDAKAVPRRFAPELPNPVPGADQSAWGYPVTLQLFGNHDDGDVAMRLRLGGAEVPCHYSTPRHPTNPLLAPAAAFCLIPKTTLAAGATYTVTAEGLPKGASVTWSFTTAAK